jgi:hypothetical protein
MKKEYEEKLKLVTKHLARDDSLSVEDNRKFFWQGHKMMEELILTKDEEVLCGLFDLFTQDNENGVCETLENEIYHNFDFSQIINVLYRKFDSLIENNILRARNISCACINVGKFEEFREMFNFVRSKNSALLLGKAKNNKYNKEIAILTKDMAGW